MAKAEMAKADLADGGGVQGARSPAPDRRRLSSALALPGVIFLVLLLLPAASMATSSDGYLLSLATRMMILAIAALALDLLVGYGGLISFGHAAFVGIGAYAVGILSVHGVDDMLISLPVAIAAAAIFAFVTGAVCLRTKGVHFIMITLAFGQMMFFLASSLAPYGGDDGLTVQTRNAFAGLALFESERSFYFLVLAGLLGVYLFCRALMASRFGRVFRGARENPERMAAMGFNVYRYRHVAYVLAGAIAGFSGFLLANATEFVSPAYMSWQRSGDLLIMVILGGIGRLNGALIGAVVFVLLEEWLSGISEHWRVIFGPFLVFIAIFARGGLLGLPAMLMRRRPRG
jgi:branched-chain amino acid transport system permease protein